MSLSSAKAKLDAQAGDPATGYISKQDHKDSYDELVADTALTGATTAADLTVNGRDVDNLIAGPASATDNALVRFDGTGGKTAQNSGVTADDSGNLTATGTVSATGLAGTLARGPSVAVGRWTNQLVGPTSWLATSQGDINNRLVVWPTWNPVAITISDLIIRVTTDTGATGTWRIGFYQLDGSNGVPSTLIADCGTVATTSTGIKTISSLSVTLPAGPIGIALCAQGIASTGAYQAAYGVGAYASFSGGATTNGAFTQASVTGALPATMTAADLDGYFLPYLLVKRSA